MHEIECDTTEVDTSVGEVIQHGASQEKKSHSKILEYRKHI